MAIKFFTTGIHGFRKRRIKEFENAVLKGYEFKAGYRRFVCEVKYRNFNSVISNFLYSKISIN